MIYVSSATSRKRACAVADGEDRLVIPVPVNYRHSSTVISISLKALASKPSLIFVIVLMIVS